MVPSFDEMLDRKPLPIPSLPELRSTQMRESLVYQNLFDSFRSIETAQELLTQKQILQATLATISTNVNVPITMIQETLRTVARQQGEEAASRLFVHLQRQPDVEMTAGAGGPPPPPPGMGARAQGGAQAPGMFAQTGPPTQPPPDGPPFTMSMGGQPFAPATMSSGGRPPPPPGGGRSRVPPRTPAGSAGSAPPPMVNPIISPPGGGPPPPPGGFVGAQQRAQQYTMYTPRGVSPSQSESWLRRRMENIENHPQARLPGFARRYLFNVDTHPRIPVTNRHRELAEIEEALQKESHVRRGRWCWSDGAGSRSSGVSSKAAVAARLSRAGRRGGAARGGL